MSLGDRKVLERPKSKWPYWVLYKETLPGRWTHSADYQHILFKWRMKEDKIPVVIERQWGGTTTWSGRKRKEQQGVLYKFLTAEDRLLFLMSQETGQ